MTRHQRAGASRARAWLLGATALVVGALVLGTALTLRPPAPADRGAAPASVDSTRRPQAAGAPRPTAVATPPPHRTLAPAEVALLPEARYDAVIPGLLDAHRQDAINISTTRDAGGSEPEGRATYSLLADAPLYGADRATAVARLAAVNFLGEPTVIAPVLPDGEWSLVLTPARQALPSAAGGNAPAQTAAWIRTDALVHPRTLDHRVVVSVSEQSLTILVGEEFVDAFAVGIGTPDTPTPIGVTGYLQARYLDPAQGQAEHRVQLTSLHSSSRDEPYGGTDGGLIGIHHSDAPAGSVSHGCIRLAADAIAAVDALPLGTPVSVIA